LIEKFKIEKKIDKKKNKNKKRVDANVISTKKTMWIYWYVDMIENPLTR
jgi:hypothetical protein